MHATSGDIFPLYVHSLLLPSPFHFPHRLIKRYSLMMMVMVMMVMKEIFVFIRALSQADLIFLFGARLNWILHFGKPPRFKADVKIVQVLLQAQLNLLLSQVSISNSSLSFPDIFCMFFFFAKCIFSQKGQMKQSKERA